MHRSPCNSTNTLRAYLGVNNAVVLRIVERAKLEGGPRQDGGSGSGSGSGGSGGGGSVGDGRGGVRSEQRVDARGGRGGGGGPVGAGAERGLRGRWRDHDGWAAALQEYLRAEGEIERTIGVRSDRPGGGGQQGQR